MRRITLLITSACMLSYSNLSLSASCAASSSGDYVSIFWGPFSPGVMPIDAANTGSCIISSLFNLSINASVLTSLKLFSDSLSMSFFMASCMISIAFYCIMLFFVAFFRKSSWAVRLFKVITLSKFFIFSSSEMSDLYIRRVVNKGILMSLNHVRRHCTFGSGKMF